MTNLNKTREEIIYEIVLSLNSGNISYPKERVRIAIDQYNVLVNNGIISEVTPEPETETGTECSHDWVLTVEKYEPFGGCFYKYLTCKKCGQQKIERI